MKKQFTRLLIFAFLVLPFLGSSQGENNIWYFGEGAGLDFNSGPPFALTNANYLFMSFAYSTSVSDSLGNLLFYADESYVYNKNNQIMPNGSLLGPGQGLLQPTFAVKILDQDSVYYLFCMDSYPYIGHMNPIGLSYTIIDLRLDDGLGDIPPGQTGIPVPGAGNTDEMVTGTRAHNNKDVWIVARRYTDGNLYYSYHITNAGIDAVPVISTSQVPLCFNCGMGWLNGPEMMQFSPDGKRLVVLYDTVNEFCQFNPSTGEITPMFCFKTDTLGHSNFSTAEFSIDNKFLYVGAQNLSNGNTFYQYDASKTDSAQFKQSEIKIHQNAYESQLERGPDNKIYCTHLQSDLIDVINNPSLQGAACNYQTDAVWLEGKHSWRGFPQHLQRYYAYIHHTYDCVNQQILFHSTVWPPADSIHWDFGDPASTSDNTSNLPDPTHLFTSTGSFIITLFVRHIDKRTDTAWQTITILPSPNPQLGPDRTICLGNTTTFDAGFCTGCTYSWSNLTLGLLNIGNGQTYTTGDPALYQVMVTMPNGCYGSGTVQLFTTPLPQVTNNPLSKSICSGDSTHIPLTSNVPGATFHWTASLTSGIVTGYSQDSGLIINQVLVNSLPTPGIVTYHITPKVGSCIGTTIDFPVTVNPGDSVKINISASANNVCAGTSVTFTVNPINGGTSPVYQWKVNGIIVGNNNPVYSYIPDNGDVITCTLTSNAPCASGNPATSNAVTMIVNPLNPVSITISPSANPVCAGTQVTFTAAIINAGPAPFYQWKVNGLNVGSNQSTYTYNPASGDLVSCVLTSNIQCPAGNPATSNMITMTVNPNLPVSINITASANPVCSGNEVTYSAATMYGGPAPFYQWKVNGVNAGTNLSTYTYNPASGDQIKCVLTSNIACPIGNPATSNIITMNVPAAPVVTFIRCFDSITTMTAQPFRLKGGIPLGGTYSGPGVSNGIFHPAIAGVGPHQITYTYTNAALCAASSTVTIITIVTPVTYCGQPFTDIRDGKSYQTVKIGNQCWMASNLNYGTMIPANSSQRDNCIPEKYCPNDIPADCGLLTADYQWDEIMNYGISLADQGLCPPGWHVPSEADWNRLFTEYTNNGFAASPLKYSGFSGFNALLNGALHLNEKWDYQGFATFFWSSTAHSTLKAWAHGMNDPDPSVSSYPAFRTNAFSVRCLKD